MSERTVATDALETLGTIIDETAGRDAIHLAVEPIIAMEKLYPGQDVGLVEGGAGKSDNPVGIVDPFLKAPVMPGERFWLVVYPRQITSLRHVWSHSAFQNAPRVSADSPSEQWIREYAARIPLRYDTLMDAADTWVESTKDGGWGEFLTLGGLLEGEYVPDEFWPHYEAVRGTTVPEEQRGSFFNCSC